MLGVTPFLQFRIWLRRSSTGQKAFSLLGVGAALALVIWAAVPSPRSIQSIATGPIGTAATQSTAQPTAANRTGSSGVVGGSTGVGGAAGVAGAGQTGAVGASGTGNGGIGGRGGPTGQSSAPTSALPVALGSGSSQCTKMGILKIGVALPEAAGGTLNTVIGAPPAAQEQADYAAVFDSINKAGGVDCYDLSGDYFQADETNPSSVQAGCLQFVQDKDFAVLGGFEPASPDTCLLQNHLATIEQLAVPEGDVQHNYPYYFSIGPTYETLYKNFVGAANQMGFFGPARHFKKIGIFYRDCNAEINQAMLSDLAAVGVSGTKVDRYNLGCNAQFASPSSEQAGVLQFKTDGVTTVTVDNDLIDLQQLTTIANTEDFHPAGGWVIPDDGSVAVTASANFHPDGTEFNNAVAITDFAYGAIASNLPQTPGTVACNKIMTSHGLPAVYQSPDTFAGSTCSLIWMLVAAIQHGGPNPTDLAAGLYAAKSTQVSFPDGPDDFSIQGTTTGGEYWRPVTYHSNCQCWVLLNDNYSPSF